MKPYRHTVVVRGSGPFPLDMIRYDGLVPQSSVCTHDITQSIKKGDFDNERAYSLYKYTHREWQPTHARWKSFGFSVITHMKEEV